VSSVPSTAHFSGSTTPRIKGQFLLDIHLCRGGYFVVLNFFSIEGLDIVEIFHTVCCSACAWVSCGFTTA
jgi:hypothetical protein